MKTEIRCPKCGAEMTTRNVSPGYAYACEECDEDFYDWEACTRYFPDCPTNKVFTVDAHVALCKVFKVEAATSEEAESLVRSSIEDMLRGVEEMEAGHVLEENGFHDCEDVDVKASGEADVNGDIEYY